MNMENSLSAEEKREIGKIYFYHGQGDREKKNYGLKLILEAMWEGDAEAKFLVAQLVLNGSLRPRTDDPEKEALMLMHRSALGGGVRARAYLNAYCENRYREMMGKAFSSPSRNGALVDFEGKPVRIDRRGVFTPVDAVLEYVDGRNVLTLSTNLAFLYTEEVPRRERFEQAVVDGLLAWEGEYEVFGGQRLSVRVKVTTDNKLYDNLVIFPMTDGFSSLVRETSERIGTKKSKAELSELLDHKRSFAFGGFKWSVNSRKMIYLFSESGSFDDYGEIMHVTKHEFGHALGLGDLYASEIDSLKGIEKGTYTELDGYAIDDRFYNLVMCDHCGPVSNNDLEMVLLAYMENKMQLFQPGRSKGKISSALGKGN